MIPRKMPRAGGTGHAPSVIDPEANAVFPPHEIVNRTGTVGRVINAWGAIGLRHSRRRCIQSVIDGKVKLPVGVQIIRSTQVQIADPWDIVVIDIEIVQPFTKWPEPISLV